MCFQVHIKVLVYLHHLGSLCVFTYTSYLLKLFSMAALLLQNNNISEESLLQKYLHLYLTFAESSFIFHY